MRTALVTLLLVLWNLPILSAQVNFSGRWVYDRGASTLPYSGGFMIIHFGNHLTMTQLTREGETSSIEYNLDGFEHSVERGERTFQYRAILEGNVLRIAGTITSGALTQDMGEDQYILSDNGQTLTHLTTVFDPRDDPKQIRKLIFRKQ